MPSTKSGRHRRRLPAYSAFSSAKLLPVFVVAAIFCLFAAFRLSTTFSKQLSSRYLMGLGQNSSFQLGSSFRPVDPPKLAALPLPTEVANLDVTAIKAGHRHTLMLARDGRVFAWGSNNKKAVADSNLININRATLVDFPGLQHEETITQIDTARDHNLALTSQGRVFAWGSNFTGQLGDGTNTDSAVPKLVAELPVATAIAAGYRHSTAITNRGEVYGWGGSCSEQAQNAAQATLDTLGGGIAALGAYGSGAHTELDTGDVGECSTNQSTFVQSKTPQKLNGLQGKAVAVSAGFGHILVLTDDNKVFSAGCNSFGQLGRDKATGDDKNDLNEVKTSGQVKQVAAGFRHSVALLEGGKMLAWGYNGEFGALQVDKTDLNVNQPTAINTRELTLGIEAAHDTTFALTADDALLGWGQDDANSFWPTGAASIHNLGTFKSAVGLPSAGLQHMVMLGEVR